MTPDPNKLLGQFAGFQQQLQEQLAAVEVEGSAGGGMVTVFCHGRQEIIRVRIDPGVVVPTDVELLEDLRRAAVNEAQNRARGRAQEEIRKLLGDLPLPDGLKPDSLLQE
jgi:DNA-binding YbaB/EbfC family protein